MTIKTIINDDLAEYDFDGIKKCMIEMYDYEDGNIPDKDVWEYIYNVVMMKGYVTLMSIQKVKL